MLSRRRFLAASAATLAPADARADGRPPRVLLRSSWQTVNIGDIAHTPGLLRLFEQHLPAAEVTLWPNPLSAPVRAMLTTRFPKLRLAETKEAQAKAVADCDVCVHGSGPGLVGAPAVATWQATGKPYGFAGVTLNDAELKTHRDLLAGAKFVFCRDTLSLEALKKAAIAGPAMAFGPDATFRLDLRDDAKADAFLKDHKLEAGRFACFVPRLRWTPYWKDGRKMPADEVARKEAENAKHRDTDHAKLRAAIVAWVRRTGHKALLCPEMTYAVELLRPLLFDPLPADVKPSVVARPGYWLTDEAASTYARAAAVVSLEMHSPIIAVANGTPAIHLRQPTDTRKGQMWRDAGLGDWLFEIDAATSDQIADRLLAIHRDPDAAKALVAKAQAFTAATGKAMIAATAACLGVRERPGSSRPSAPPAPPGTVISHSPTKTNAYIGSPSLAVLPSGEYVASHDLFGPGSTKDTTLVFASADGGKTWAKRAAIKGQWWSTLFVHQGGLYLLGTSKEYGACVVRRSADGGRTWTDPRDAGTGLLLADGRYHCAPVPVLAHAGRLWRAMEEYTGPRWGAFKAFMMSAPLDTDLLEWSSGAVSNRLAGDPAWLGGTFGGWLEGNAVATPAGQVVNVLRVHQPGYPERAAVASVSADGRTIAFDPAAGFLPFPGGGKKFTIRFDPASKRYWTLTNFVPKEHEGPRPDRRRNTLALARSPDLKTWDVTRTVLSHPDPARHGFQYPDWQFAGDALLAVVRTASDEPSGDLAPNQHDANYLTFHRVEGFRG